jgi:hypothetical protein
VMRAGPGGRNAAGPAQRRRSPSASLPGKSRGRVAVHHQGRAERDAKRSASLAGGGEKNCRSSSA